MFQLDTHSDSESFPSLAFLRRRGSILLLALTLFVMLLGPALADPTFPKLTGRVVDGAGMLSEADKQFITEKLRQLEEKSTDQLVVVTLPSLQGYAIEEFGVRLGRHWQIGQKDKNNGVLLIVAPKDRKVRIEVGYGLEGTLTDTLAGNIVHNRILPLFRKGKMPDGIKTGVDDIIATLTGDAAAVAERAKGRKRSASRGLDPGTLLLFGFWGLMFFTSLRSSLFGRSSRGGVIIVPVGTASSSWNSGGGFSSGGGSSGGGFSGGGGSFGGGGASGGW